MAGTALAKCQFSGNSTSFHLIFMRTMKLNLFITSEWKSVVSPLGLVHSVPDPTLVVICNENMNYAKIQNKEEESENTQINNKKFKEKEPQTFNYIN